MDHYTTISGQTWDQIAYEVYGDEHYCDKLMDANRQYLDYLIFPAGLRLSVPDKEDLAKESSMEPADSMDWRALLDGRS